MFRSSTSLANNFSPLNVGVRGQCCPFKLFYKMELDMRIVLAIAISGIFLTGCGSSDSGEVSRTVTEPSITDISGIWDGTEIKDGVKDIRYIVVKDYGEIVIYNYTDDLYDKGIDCYNKHSMTATDLGDGIFELMQGDMFMKVGFSLIDSELVYNGPGDPQTYPKSDYSESDFSPICEGSTLKSRGFN